ncbi:GNAT family N-acetyltransferase [Streptacidiphilus sp. PB12-B1b]|uniref:GNAT family N-acetyltransferase n=1 Tax=Streptacidiphilus sp. PB12-B1b TaxID=2705012 RepID=UPI0015F9F8D5|nr:GNAT family N-acetyltransferase [Streptacidiphilus sp. PB12-B1b]QMU74913.1 GNAT family N-acetyltransferase [Streptacidiphilus sp. PB12-B1b]
MPTIRPYRPADREALYDICVRTGDAGADATGLYRDPGILPAIFTGPYLQLAPELAFVLADGPDAERPLGYVIGTADTRRYVADYRRAWLPLVAGQYPEGSGEGPDAERVRELHHPEWMLADGLADRYPAHLHIDLLPQAQGRGAGRALMDTFLAALRAAGAERVHLGMARRNTGARAFYDRLGFHEIDHPGPALVLGRDTAALV